MMFNEEYWGFSKGSNNGFAVGDTFLSSVNQDKGIILKTTDGGVTWNSQLYNSTYNFWSVYFPTPDIGYVTGGPFYPSGLGGIMKTVDGGMNWVIQTDTIDAYYLFSVFCLDANTCYVGGIYGTILKTTNGGGLGINDELGIRNDELKITIFPNPLSDVATLRITNYEIKIYDLLGKEVMNKPIRNSDTFVIRRGNLPAGMYLYKVTGDRGQGTGEIIATGKIIIQ